MVCWALLVTRLYYGYCVLYSGVFFWVVVSLSFSLSLPGLLPSHLSLTFSRLAEQALSTGTCPQAVEQGLGGPRIPSRDRILQGTVKRILDVPVPEMVKQLAKLPNSVDAPVPQVGLVWQQFNTAAVAATVLVKQSLDLPRFKLMCRWMGIFTHFSKEKKSEGRPAVSSKLARQVDFI